MQFLKRFKYILIQLSIFLFFLIIVYINKLPSNSAIVGGDFYQAVDLSGKFSRYFYSWINQTDPGAFNVFLTSYPFYTLLAFLKLIGFNSSIIISSSVFFLLLFSYLSFYFSVRAFNPNLTKLVSMGGGLIYVLNSFTFNIFTYSWGFSHHFLIYIFTPPLILLYLKILFQKENNRSYAIFLLIFLLSTIAYNNLAFLASIFLAQFILLILSITIKKIFISKELFSKLLKISIIYVVSLFWFIIPYYIVESRTFNSSHIIGFKGDTLKFWLEATSSNFLNSFYLETGNFKSLVEKYNFLSFLPAVYFIVITFALLKLHKIKDREIKKQILLLSSTLLLFIFLSTRVYGPFEYIGILIYTNPLFSIFRSSEKIFIMIPFFYSILLVILLHYLKIRDRTVLIIFGVLLLIPYPFYVGGISNILTADNADGYRYAVQVPKEYYDVQKLINSDRRLASIISLPYSVNNSINWSNYPKWHLVGTDILYLLYDKLYISANVYDHPIMQNKLSFKEFNKDRKTPEDLLRMIQKFSGQFIFYHKDIVPKWIKKTQYVDQSLKLLMEQSKLRLVTSNGYFDLYKVNNKYLTPLIFTGSQLWFQKINPTKYKIYLNIKKNENLVFHQSYDSNWKLYLVENPTYSWCDKLGYYSDYKTTECNSKNIFFQGEELSYFYKKSVFDKDHTMVSDYANEWNLSKDYIKSHFDSSYYKRNPDGSIDIEMVLYYQPQSYFYLGIVITVLILFSSSSYLGIYYYHRRG